MSFDLLAPHYRWMEFLLAGEKLQRCRTAHLPNIPNAKNILLLGEGHGRALVECKLRFPDARITCLDASAEMLAESQRRVTKSATLEGIQFVHADILQWTPPAEKYDLIVTNFFLDCFRPEQLEKIVAKIAAAATRDANWLVADFQVAESGLKAIRSRLILGVMYIFFRTAVRLPAARLTAPDLFLKRGGFALCQRRETEWGLLHADWWHKAEEINASRANWREAALPRQKQATTLPAGF